ncbi:uncharacterized protein LOC141930064 [Strix aluco]|uniref:uncharacterized protein LOC141930064 n=1 Tax=Strix aluco TaxID=111821 RepID=UPI003DA34ED0
MCPGEAAGSAHPSAGARRDGAAAVRRCGAAPGWGGSSSHRLPGLRCGGTLVPRFLSLSLFSEGISGGSGGGIGTRQKHRCLPVTSGARAARVPPQPVQSSGSRAPVPPGPPCAPRSFQRANNGGKRRIAENNRNEPHSLPTSGLGAGPGASPREGRGFARSGGGCGTSGFPSLKLHTVVLAAKDPELKAITDPKGMASSFGPRKHACLKTKTSGMEKICQCVVSVQIFYDASNKTKFAFAGSPPHMYMTC